MDSRASREPRDHTQGPRRTASGLARLTRTLSTLSLKPPKEEISSETQGSVRGPLGLSLLFAPSEPIVDFVFVHGLRGGSRKTWSKSPHPSHFWPKEWLPVDPGFRSVRIHTFGYNADWVDRRESILNIHDFAQSLLGDLHDSRHLRKDADLPIVLIAHSMGGLVIKKAYLLACQDPIFQDLGKRIHSMYFLATPHRGSDSAALLASLLRLSHGHKPFLNEIQKKSPSTQSINDEFRHVSESVRLHSFYETLPTNIGVSSVMIVEKTSAIMGYSHERVDFLEANHRDICKFDTPGDPNFKRLRNSLVATIDDVTEKWIASKAELIKEQKRYLENFLGILGKPDDDLAAVQSLRTEDSCEWLMDAQPFQNWQNGEGAKIFWLTAKPATGKSILAGYVVSYLEELNKDCSYYFFNQSKQVSSDLARCLRSIAYQMSLLNPSIREKLVRMHQDQMQYDKDNYQFIWRKIFLGGVFTSELNQPQYWVIDSLDDCQNHGDFKAMLANIEDTFPLRIFITSRSLSESSKRALQKEKDITFEDIRLENTIEDIKLYVTRNLHRLPLHDEDEDEEARLELVSTILEKSFGCFLWVKLIFEQLAKVFCSADIREVLEQAPAGMDSLYSKIVKNMSTASCGKSLTKAILIWTVCAARPLKVEELKYALQLDTNTKIYNLESAIASTCGQLLFVDPQSRVHVIHQTARDFLLKLDQTSEFGIDLAEGHGRLAATCLRYLLGTEMRVPVSRWRRSGQIPTNREKFVDYACTAFYEHIRHTTSSDDALFIQLETFLNSPQVLSWIEYVAHTGDLNHLIRTGKILRTYVERRAKYKFLPGKDAELAHPADAWGIDLIRLVARFGTNLLESPSSIFWLIPSFCPPASALHRKFAESTRGVIIKGLSATSWDDPLACILYHQKEQPSAVVCDDSRFAIGLTNGQLEIYNLMTCQRVKIFHHEESIRVLEFSPSSKLLASAGRQYVRLWNLTSGDSMWSYEISQVCLALAFTDNQKTLIAATRDNRLTYCEVSTGREIRICPWFDEKDGQPVKPQRQPMAVAFSVELMLLAINYRGRLILWDLQNDAYFGFCGKESQGDSGGKIKTTFIMDLTFSPAPNTALLAAAYQDDSLALFDPTDCITKKVVSKVNAQKLASSPDGRTLVSGDASGTIQVFEFETLKLMYRLNSDDVAIKALAFSSDSLRFIDIRGRECNVWAPAVLVRQEINDETSEKLSTVADEVHVEEPDEIVTITAIICHPSGEYVFCGKEDGTMNVYLIETGQKDRQLYNHTTGISIVSVDFGAEDNLLVSGDNAGRILAYKVTETFKKWTVEGPVLDMKFGHPISQLFLTKTLPTNLIVSSPNSDALFTLKGSLIRQLNPDKRRAGCWTQHPSNTQQLLLVVDGIIYIFDPKELTQTGNIKLALDSSDEFDVKSLAPYCNGTLIGIELFHYKSSRSMGQFHLWSMASLVSDANSASPLPEFNCLASMSMHIIGAYGEKLLFLDRHGWVCSIDLSAFAGQTYTRYFFVPSDWLSCSGEMIFHVTSKGDLVFVKRDEIVVIKRGLNIGEMTPLRK